MASPYTCYGRWSIITVRGGGGEGQEAHWEDFVSHVCSFTRCGGRGKLLEPKRSRRLLLLWLGDVQGGGGGWFSGGLGVAGGVPRGAPTLDVWLWTSRIGDGDGRVCVL